MVTIRPFEPDDLDACAELYVRVFAEPPWNEEWQPAEAREHLRHTVKTPGFVGMVAVDGDRVVGMVTGSCRSHAAGHFAMLDDMFVDVPLRGQGIGQRLMDELKGHLKATDCIAVGLLTQRTSRAAAFYRRYGFVEDPSVRFMLLDLGEQTHLGEQQRVRAPTPERPGHGGDAPPGPQ
ncbi:MAG TPA: GNAT family N-acetyltransferase [Ktedonobacterales bacterium]